jgi:aspartate/methionine/tyrosine aminotransferase
LNDTFLGANSLTQSMLPALFAQGAGFVTHMRTQIQNHLDMALEMLAQCPAIQAQPPDGGYYLFPEVQGWDSEDDLVLHLLDKGVLVHPGYFYGYERGVHIMISALTEQEKLKAGLRILIDTLNTYQS